MIIKRVHSNLMDYELGKNNVVAIELSNQGSENNTTYLIHFISKEFLFAGFLEHEIEYAEMVEVQTDIFDYL